MTKVADNKKAHGTHKAHGHKGDKKPAKKPPVKHVHHHHHHHHTVNNTQNINVPAPTQPTAYPQPQLPEYGSLLGANQDLFNGFTAFLGQLFGSVTGSAPPLPSPALGSSPFDYPQFTPVFPGYPQASTSWPSAPTYPSNGSAGGWGAWGAARGAAAY